MIYPHSSLPKTFSENFQLLAKLLTFTWKTSVLIFSILKQSSYQIMLNPFRALQLRDFSLHMRLFPDGLSRKNLMFNLNFSPWNNLLIRSLIYLLKLLFLDNHSLQEVLDVHTLQMFSISTHRTNKCLKHIVVRIEDDNKLLICFKLTILP